jgi:hypothetical protein
MLKRIVWSIGFISLLAFGSSEARAQSDEKKFEVGGQFSLLNSETRTVTVAVLPCLVPPCPTTITSTQGHATDYGIGGRLGYDFSKHFALEAEGNFFPRDRDMEGGRKIQGLFGVKTGKRFERVGVFAKARSGFVRFEKGDYRFGPGGCVTVFPPPITCFQPVARTDFAMDLGGVIELYPSRHTIIRFDAGDTIIRLGARNVAATQPAIPAASPFHLVVIPVSAETTHNLQASVGFGFRF